MAVLRKKTRRQLRGEYEDVAHGFALGVPVIVGIIVFVLALIGGGIWLATATSKARGNAGVTQQHNGTQNQIAQNEKLTGDNNTVKADITQITYLAANVQTEQDRMDLNGLVQNCDSDVAKYNGDVTLILASGYLPTGDPSSYADSVCSPPQK